MGRRLAYGFAILIALLTFAPQLVRADWWLLRSLDFPRAQLFVLALVAGGALGPFLEPPRRRPGSVANLLFAAALGAAALQGARILPYTPMWPDQVHSAAGVRGPTIRLLVANVLIDNRDSSRLLGQVDRWKPDVVVLTEPDAWWAAALRPLREDYPHVVEVPRENAYGMMLFSRLPLLDARVQYLVEPDVPSIRADVELGSRRVALRLVHPRPPIPSAGTTTERDAELLIVGREVRRLGRPAIVAGDLNDVAWSRTTRLFQRISGTLDPRRGRSLYSTFHADYPFLRWPLDHVFHTEHFELVRIARLGHNGSDHFPILVELRLTPAAPREQEPLPLDEDDRDEAREQIREAEEQ